MPWRNMNPACKFFIWGRRGGSLELTLTVSLIFKTLQRLRDNFREILHIHINVKFVVSYQDAQ